MRHVDSDDVVGFQFNSVFFDPSKQEGEDVNVSSFSHLRTLAHVRRSVSYCRVRTKYLVKPQLVMGVGVHHISRATTSHLKSRHMLASQALLHHHRQCEPYYNTNCQQFQRDDVIRVRYAHALQLRFNTTTEQFRASFKIDK